MRPFFSLLSEHFSNIREMLSGEAVKGEDEYASAQLKHYLLMRNSRRNAVISVLQFLFGAVSFIVSISGTVNSGSAGFLFLTGTVFFFGTGILFFSFYYQALNRRQHDFKRLNVYFYLYWALFICGSLILFTAEYQAYRTAYSLCALSVVVLTVPILRIFDGIIAAIIIAVPAVVYGALENLGFVFYSVLLLGTSAFVWICAERYSCYAGMWLSERQLDQSAQRCLQISHTDSLTGMLNKAGLTAKFYERYQNGTELQKIAVLLIDIDNFRQYNHRYGYDKSDRCLYNICNCIRIFAKPVTDLVSRFGGDDFVLVLENMPELEVLRFAEQIRRGVERMALPLGENGIVTISIGISEIVELKSNHTYSELLNEADIQLMVAKKGGKNCVGYRGRAFLADDRRMTR